MFSKMAMQHKHQAPGRDIHRHFSLAPARGHTMADNDYVFFVFLRLFLVTRPSSTRRWGVLSLVVRLSERSSCCCLSWLVEPQPSAGERAMLKQNKIVPIDEEQEEKSERGMMGDLGRAPSELTPLPGDKGSAYLSETQQPEELTESDDATDPADAARSEILKYRQKWKRWARLRSFHHVVIPPSFDALEPCPRVA